MNQDGFIYKVLMLLMLVIGIGLPLMNSVDPKLVPSIGAAYEITPLIDNYQATWEKMQNRMVELRNMDETNRKLRSENTALKLQNAAAQFGCEAKKAEKVTEDVEFKLRKDTGTETGRALAGLTYQVPAHISVSQLYTLGVAYLKARDDEKVAAIFTSLIESEPSKDTYRTAQNLLIAASAWYRLDNFILSGNYFDEIIKLESTPDLEYQAQARLWKALIAKKMDQDIKTQFWLQELVDHHPHAKETAWVNLPKDASTTEGAKETNVANAETNSEP